MEIEQMKQSFSKNLTDNVESKLEHQKEKYDKLWE